MVSLLELILLQPSVTVGYAELLTDGGLEDWASPIDLTHWDETIGGDSTVNRDGVNQYKGLYCARLDIDAANTQADIHQKIILPGSKKIIIEFAYKTTAGKSIRAHFGIKIAGVWYYLKSDMTWGIVDVYFFENAISTVWKEERFKTITPGGGESYLTLLNHIATSSSVYFDKVSLKQQID